MEATTTTSVTMNTRSKSCRRTKSGPCSRLSGHKGACRPTLTRAEGRTPGVEVLSADRYTDQPEPKASKPRARKTTRRPKVRTLSPAEPKVRLGITGPVGQPKAAKRAKAAPASTRSRSNSGAVKCPKGN